MRIVLACDQKWRDLPALVVIRQHLRRLGHGCVILSTKQFEALLPLVQPDVVVLNNFWDKRYHRLARQLREAGIGVAVLPTEGATPTHLWGPMVFGAYSDYSLIDFQMCWNQTTADGIADFGTMSRDKLDVIGCPRFDFAVSPLIEACMTREELCSLLELDPKRPIVSWASRFALAKFAYAAPEQRAAFDAQVAEIGYRQSVELLGHTMDELIEIYRVSLDKFIDAFSAATHARPDLQFVFKPHPNDDVNYIREKVRQSTATGKIAVGVYIGDLLRGSDVLVNADCNTSIEGWIHGVPVVDAQLYVDYVSGRPDIAAGNRVARDPDEVIALIDGSIANRSVPTELVAIRESFIKKWFHKVDGDRCKAAAHSLDRFTRAWGRRCKLYPVAYGGGYRHLARTALGWALSVPSGYTISQAMRNRDSARISGGTFDKVMTRRDASALDRRLKPLVAT